MLAKLGMGDAPLKKPSTGRFNTVAPNLHRVPPPTTHSSRRVPTIREDALAVGTIAN